MEMADAPKKASPLAVAKAVFWSFLGIRRKKDYESDSAHLTPVPVIVAGLVAAMVLVAGLILLAKLVIGRAA